MQRCAEKACRVAGGGGDSEVHGGHLTLGLDMLFADKEQLKYDNKVRSKFGSKHIAHVANMFTLRFPCPQVNLLTLQYSELDYHLSRCLTLGLQSTLVASLMYNGIVEIDDAIVKGRALRLGYYIVTYVATGVEVLCAFLSTYCAMRGPGYALKGDDGSIFEANRVMAYELGVATTLFFAGLAMTFPSVLLFIWATQSASISLGVTVALGVCTLLTLAVAGKTWRRFRIRRDEVVTSHFRADGSDFVEKRTRRSHEETAAGAPSQSQQQPQPQQQQGEPSHRSGAGGSEGITDYFRRRAPSVTQRDPEVSANGSGGSSAAPSAPPSQQSTPRTGWDDDDDDDDMNHHHGESPRGYSAGGVSPRGYAVAAGGSSVGPSSTRSGYLYKLPSSGRSGSWQRRFLSLDASGVLRWHAGETEHLNGKAKGELRLSARTEVALTGSGPTAELRISEHKKNLVLRATLTEDLEAWRRAIEAQRASLAM